MVIDDVPAVVFEVRLEVFSDGGEVAAVVESRRYGIDVVQRARVARDERRVVEELDAAYAEEAVCQVGADRVYVQDGVLDSFRRKVDCVFEWEEVGQQGVLLLQKSQFLVLPCLFQASELAL